MSCIDGFVIVVPNAKREATMILEFGAMRVMEC